MRFLFGVRSSSVTYIQRVQMPLHEVAVREFPEPPRPCADFSGGVFSRILVPTGTVVLPLTKVSRQTREEEAGGGGVTTQAGRMQECTAQRGSGKVGGVH